MINLRKPSKSKHLLVLVQLVKTKILNLKMPLRSKASSMLQQLLQITSSAKKRQSQRTRKLISLQVVLLPLVASQMPRLKKRSQKQRKLLSLIYLDSKMIRRVKISPLGLVALGLRLKIQNLCLVKVQLIPACSGLKRSKKALQLLKKLIQSLKFRRRKLKTRKILKLVKLLARLHSLNPLLSSLLILVKLQRLEELSQPPLKKVKNSQRRQLKNKVVCLEADLSYNQSKLLSVKILLVTQLLVLVILKLIPLLVLAPNRQAIRLSVSQTRLKRLDKLSLKSQSHQFLRTSLSLAFLQ